MLFSLAWRNLARNRRRSILTGSAVAFGVFLVTWALGLNEGAYNSMINQSAQYRTGHVQVLPEGYLDYPQPHLVVENDDELVEQLSHIEHVVAAAPRVQAEGMLARDNEAAPVEIVGVDPATEVAASEIPNRMFTGEGAVEWCRESLSDALPIMGNDQELFRRWCAANADGRYLDDETPRGIVIGVGTAERLLVSVGDELTAQVVRAVDDQEEGLEAGSTSQRRLEVVGLFRTGNPELDDRLAYVARGTLADMLGVEGSNEIVLILDHLRYVERVRDEAAAIVGSDSTARVTTWRERNPALAAMIDMDSGQGSFNLFIICVLVTLGVVNATLMSVLERTREFGVMLSLGLRRSKLFGMVMTEVSLLGMVSIGVGAALGLAIEIFGRVRGWDMAWFGYDTESLENMSVAGAMYETTYYAALSIEQGITIVTGMFVLFLLAGLWGAFRASRLEPVNAMRAK